MYYVEPPLNAVLFDLHSIVSPEPRLFPLCIYRQAFPPVVGIYLNDPGVRERRSKVEGNIDGRVGENFSPKEGLQNSKYWYRLAAVGLRRRRDSVLALRRGFQETPRGGAESSSPGKI